MPSLDHTMITPESRHGIRQLVSLHTMIRRSGPCYVLRSIPSTFPSPDLGPVRVPKPAHTRFAADTFPGSPGNAVRLNTCPRSDAPRKLRPVRFTAVSEITSIWVGLGPGVCLKRSAEESMDDRCFGLDCGLQVRPGEVRRSRRWVGSVEGDL